MEAGPDSQNLSVVLPNKQLPLGLSHLESSPNAQFLLGYRNVLIKQEGKVVWGLIKNDNFCGRAFVYGITETDANRIQSIRRQNEYIEVVGDSYILLNNEKNMSPANEVIARDQLQELLNQMGGINKVNINLVKSAFDTFESYYELVGKTVQDLGNLEQVKEQKGTEQDKEKIADSVKELTGENLMRVPKADTTSGRIIDNEYMTLKN